MRLAMARTHTSGHLRRTTVAKEGRWKYTMNLLPALQFQRMHAPLGVYTTKLSFAWLLWQVFVLHQRREEKL